MSKSTRSRTTTSKASKSTRESSAWKSPHGRSAEKTMRVATDKVVHRYKDALGRLKNR